MQRLSPRLKMTADMVREGAAVADIGTDHAYLSAYLVVSGKCPRALASDLRDGPGLAAGDDEKRSMLIGMEKTIREYDSRITAVRNSALPSPSTLPPDSPAL